jgi:hypothetical protein
MSASGGASQGAPPAFTSVLAPHVHAAELGAITVLLDLKRDRYLAVPTGSLERLHQAQGQDKDVDALRARFAADGVLAGDRCEIDWWGFWRACLWAGRVVASKRLDRGIDQIRRARRLKGAHAPAQGFVSAFDAMRPWFPRRMVCLFDSLALMSFLSRHGARGDLVFGVRGMPFSAHCWVEDNGAPLNDEPAYCASFQPILRV